jgi:hypothetical protein
VPRALRPFPRACSIDMASSSSEMLWSKSPNSLLTIDVSGTGCSERSICHALIFLAVERIRGYCGRVFVSSSILCCVECKKSGSLKNLESVSSPKPERCVGFESLGGGDGDGMSLGLWLKLRDSSRRVRAFPALLGGEDCIICN